MLLSLLPGARLNSSVLAMLPKQTLGAIPPALNDGLCSASTASSSWLVSPNSRTARGAAVVNPAATQPGAECRKGPLDAAGQQAWGDFFWQHRNGLVDPATRARLQNGGQAQASGSCPSSTPPFPA